jgi:hypothetical protein
MYGMTDAEMNEVLGKHYDKAMPKDEKKVIGKQIDRIRYVTRVKSYDRAKIGKASSLEILYKLGRFLGSLE